MQMTEPIRPSATVRAMRPEDLSTVLAWRNHVEVRRYMYTQHEISKTEHQAWFKRASQDDCKSLLIFELNEQPIGFVNFNKSKVGAIADWGFYLAPDVPKGSGRLLGRTALAYAFNELALHKVCGEALAFNERSLRLHLTLGFTNEGNLRDQYFDGVKYHNVIAFGLLADEWPPETESTLEKL